jgi:hypothetical protein
MRFFNHRTHPSRASNRQCVGGKREPYDESANHTACREMSEESGGGPKL